MTKRHFISYESHFMKKNLEDFCTTFLGGLQKMQQMLIAKCNSVNCKIWASV